MAVTHITCLTTEQATLDTQRDQAFYRENLGLIYRYVYSKMGNREEAEDLTSQIFLKAVRGLKRAADLEGVASVPSDKKTKST